MKSDNSTVSKKIYNLCKDYFEYEKYITSDYGDKKFKGYLINKKYIDEFKNKIFYDKLYKYIRDNYPFNKLKNIIEKENLEKIKINIVTEKCDNLEEFKKCLDSNKEYYIITDSLKLKIYEIEKKISKKYEKEISCELKNKNSIILNFDNEKFELKINKGMLIKEKKIKDKVQDIVNIKNNNLVKSEFNNKYKNDIEILIRLYMNYKEIKEKLNNMNFQELNEDNKYSIYLINNNWIKNYKLFFEYEQLEKYLNDNIQNLNIQNNYILSYEKISKIISDLPIEYLNIIMKKNIDEIKKNISMLSFNDYKKINNKEYKYFDNFQIINNNIFGKLISTGYIFQDYMKQIDCYFLKNKKLLLYFDKKVIQIISNDIIGYINDDNIFIPEYLLIYQQNDIVIRNLNHFLSKNFTSDKSENNYEIKLENNILIGNCYKIL